MRCVSKIMVPSLFVGACIGFNVTGSQAQSVLLVPSSDTLMIGESGTIEVFVSADTLVDQGLGLDISSSSPSVVFTDATVENPAVTSGLTAALNTVRWQDTGIDSIESAQVLNARGFVVTEGAGLDPLNADGSNPFELVDQGYDSVLDAFLFATLTFDAAAEGLATISSDVGQFDIVTAGNSIADTFSFGSTTITVVPVPEPTSLALLGIGAGALVMRRRAR